ncbi:toll-like receptor 5b [Myripristis murdjan]|uniref:toll-like receptor 5b n=1 Tax=Myripristis murdjan TaxID=586833 RepID=UPI0011761CC7|nr:toll-like receptor 5 [Myripristis murdjan]
MSKLVLQLVVICVYLQVPRCYLSCQLYNTKAWCAFQRHSWVPALPPYTTHLFLEVNNIREINHTSLSNLEELQELDLGKQNVPLRIRNNAFLRQQKLTKLNLGYNIGLQLEPKAFVGLHNLQILELYYCNLNESILEEQYLQPLSSLESLNLFGNQIKRLRPALFFLNLINLAKLNLKLNRINRICERDLAAFRDKYFHLLNLESTYFRDMFLADFDWEECGNPFRGISFNQLDLSRNELSTEKSRQFFRAIAGTQIGDLRLSGPIGRGFGFDRFTDPDRYTFESLNNSSVVILNLTRSYIFALQEGVFSPLKEVIIIDISHNKVNRIDRRAFDGVRGHLQMLDLSSNLLGEIYSHMFVDMTDLRVLDLSYNHIGVLEYRAFSGLPKLQTLRLTGNSLRNLGSPASLPELDYFFLDDNKLDHTSQGAIITLASNSIYLNVANNRLTNMEDVYVFLSSFKRLQRFYYGGNFIKWCKNPNISVSHSNSLQVLDLHDSSLQIIWAQGRCLDLFDSLQNLIGLNLRLNSLTALPQGIFRGLRSVVVINLSSNFLTYLQPDVFPTSLQTLDLSNNFLASPDPMTFQSLSVINLAMNRFHCDCHLESFLTWLNETNVTFLIPVGHFQCEFPPDLYGVSLLDYYSTIEPCDDEDRAAEDLRLALFIFSGLFLLLFIIGVIAYAHLRGQIFLVYKKIVGRVLEGPKVAPSAGDVKYDAYFCFSDSDYKWVEAALLKKLDTHFSEGNILRCCFEARDFLPGEDHLSNIRDAVWSSRKTVCIVSKKFLKDGWCLEAFTLAQSRMLEELSNVLIMLLVERVPHYQLMKYNAIRAFVQRREYLVWPEDTQDLEWFYEKLVSHILKNTETKKRAEDVQVDVEPKNEDGIELEHVRAQEM